MTRNDVLIYIRKTCQSLTVTYLPDTKEFRITLKVGTKRRKENVAYYTEDKTDAINTALAMQHYETYRMKEFLYPRLVTSPLT